jgi:zinc transporter ZupT
MNAQRIATKFLPGVVSASFGGMIGSVSGLVGWWVFFSHQPLPLFTIVGFVGGSLLGVGTWGAFNAIPVHETSPEPERTAKA